MLLIAVVIAFAMAVVGTLHVIAVKNQNLTFRQIVAKLESKVFFNLVFRYLVTAYLKLYIIGVQSI